MPNFIGGHIFQGASGCAGEAGHTTIDPNGPPCQCGNHGCWERLASQYALIERIQKAIRAGQRSLIEDRAKHDLDQITIQVILEAARSGDDVSRRALEETGLYLGIGIANLVNIFNPNLVAFGGTLSLADEFLMPIVRQVVLERAMKEPREAVQITVSTFKSDACVMGGAALILREILNNPTAWQPKPLPSAQTEEHTVRAPSAL